MKEKTLGSPEFSHYQVITEEILCYMLGLVSESRGIVDLVLEISDLYNKASVSYHSERKISSDKLENFMIQYRKQIDDALGGSVKRSVQANLLDPKYPS